MTDSSTLKRMLFFLLTVLSFSSSAQLTWEYRGGNPIAPIIGAQAPTPPGPVPAGLDTAIQPQAFGTNRFGSVAFGDVDGDGDQDFFSGSRIGEIYYHENTGTPSNPFWLWQPMPSTDTIDIAPLSNINECRPALVDIDGDGDLDLFIGSRYDYNSNNFLNDIHFYRNIGTPTAPEFSLEINNVPGLHNQNVGEFSGFAFADLDADGDQDMISGGSDSLNYFENVGTPTVPSFVRHYHRFAGVPNPNNPFSPFPHTSFLAPTPSLDDLDGDGDFDLSYGREDGFVHWIENIGTPTVPNFDLANHGPIMDSVGLHDFGSFIAMDIADVTNDGVLDIMVCTFQPSAWHWYQGVTPCSPTTSSFSVEACPGTTYTVPSGDEMYTTAGVYMDTISNVCGDDSVMTITLTFADNDLPNAICQNHTAYMNSSGLTSISAVDIDGGSSDACGVMSIIPSITSFNCAQIGANNVTLTVTDVNSNVNTCVAVVTVVDTISPLAVCQNHSAYLDAGGNTTLSINDIDNGSSDNCGTISSSLSQTSFTCADLGANNVTLTTEDNEGNTSSCVAVVTVLDTISPSAVCQNINVYLDGGGNASIVAADIDGGSSDNCGVPSMSLSQTTFTCVDIGTNNITLTTTDGSSNTAICSAVVTVLDTISPALTCPGNQIETPDVSCNFTLPDYISTLSITSSDNCGAPTITQSPVAGTVISGTTTVFISSTDANGNVTQCSFDVSLQDATAPTAVCQSATIYLDASGNANLIAVDVDGGSSDNCAGLSLLVSQSAFTCSDIGANNVTLTVTDGAGLTDNCAAIVTVIDTISPTIAGCPANINIAANNSGCEGIVMWTAPAESDNCSGVTLSSSHNSGDSFPLGTTTVTYTATDASGNVAVCSFDVSITNNLTITVDSLHHPTCFDSLNGQAFITVTGGTSGFMFDWDYDGIGDNDDMEDQNGLGDGSYNVTVTDANGCTVLSMATLIQPTAISVTSNITNVLCYGDSSGTATLNSSGGTGTLVEGWGLNDPMSLPEGTFIYVITDSNGCVYTDSVMISQPDSLQLNATSTDELLGNDGTIDLTVIGGIGPFDYDWDNDGTGDNDDTEDLSGLTSGNYTVIVYDDNGCSDTLSIDVGSQVGVNDINKLSFKLYPNPSTGEFTIELNERFEIGSTVQVLSTVGQLMYQQKINAQTTQLNLGDMAKGVYFVRLNNGENYESIRLVIQ